MAKLSARGRTEAARFERTTNDDEGGTFTRTLAFMSDGSYLEKLSTVRRDGSRHSWAWTVGGKYQTVGGVREVLARKGYAEVTK